MPVDEMTDVQARQYFGDFIRDVFIPQRSRLIAYSRKTIQSAQVDSDGYLGQILASIVLGVPGNSRRGKSGLFSGDLADGTEVKSAYRIEQMNGKEDSHVNFGQITPKKMTEFMDRERGVAVHVSYDVLGRPKIEVLLLPLRTMPFIDGVADFQARSSSARPQLQPRLYPDGARNRLQLRPGGFWSLGARLLARAVVVGDDVVVDKWDPDGLDLTECLDVLDSPVHPEPTHTILDVTDPLEFFRTTMIAHRRALEPYCAATGSNQNVGFGNLAQHLVSIVTGKPGTGSGARGFDLADSGEIKLAMGSKGDPLGTEDYPRLNLGSNVAKMHSWGHLYPVRIMCDDDGLMVKVFEVDIEEFRAQVDDYFSFGSDFENSTNIQYHAPKTFSSNVFTGLNSKSGPRRLEGDVLFEGYETVDGKANVS